MQEEDNREEDKGHIILYLRTETGQYSVSNEGWYFKSHVLICIWGTVWQQLVGCLGVKLEVL